MFPSPSAGPRCRCRTAWDGGTVSPSPVQPRWMSSERPSATSVRISPSWRGVPPIAWIWSGDTSRVSTQPGQSETRNGASTPSLIFARRASPWAVLAMPSGCASRTASPARRTSASSPAPAATVAKWYADHEGRGSAGGRRWRRRSVSCGSCFPPVHASTCSNPPSLAASSSRVYSWRGLATSSSLRPASTIAPSRITTIRSETQRATARSWVM